MRETCPDSQFIAAHLEGGLEPAKGEALLDHAAGCDECRRELALGVLVTSSGAVPDGLRSRALAAVLAAVERARHGASTRLRVARACPDSQIIAAQVDGRLGDADAEGLLDHAADCDDCRREMALTALAAGGAPVPAEVQARVRAAVAQAAAANRGASTRLRIIRACPDSEVIAAWIDGTLADPQPLLEHAEGCDDCRREIALLRLGRGAAGEAVPRDLHDRARKAVVSAVERERGSRRIHIIRRQRTSMAPFAAAAAVLFAVAVLLLLYFRPKPEEPLVRDSGKKEKPEVVRPPERVPEPETAPRRIEWPPIVPEEKPEPQREVVENAPRPEPPRPVPAPEKRPDDVVKPGPGPEKTPPRPEEKPRETVVARTYSPVTLTDLTGELSLRRKGKKEGERVKGVVSVGDGDVLIADKLTAFFLLNDFPIALMPKTAVSVAIEKGTNAPALTLETGEALVDSSARGGSKWLLSDGSRTVTLDKTKSKFSAAIEEKTLAITAISGSLSGKDDSGRTFAIRAGEKLTADDMARKPEPAVAKKASTLASARPAERTSWFFDGKTAPIEGMLEKVPRSDLAHLRSAEKKGVHTVRVLPKGATWHSDLVIRARLLTNLQDVRIGIDVEDRMQLGVDVKVRRDQRRQWITVEIPWEDLRVVGGMGGTIRAGDEFTSLYVSGNQRDVFGDERGFILIDELQIVEKNP